MIIASTQRTTVAVTTLVTADLCAAVAWIHDARFDLAADNLVKANAQLPAAVVSDVPGQRCQKFVDKAVLSIDKTLSRIEQAEICAG